MTLDLYDLLLSNLNDRDMGKISHQEWERRHRLIWERAYAG